MCYNAIVERRIRSLGGAIRRGFYYARRDTMPRKPKVPCRYPGCPNLSDKPYCELHRTVENRRYNTYERAPDVNKKYGHAWKRIRDRYAAAHPLCEECLKEGKLVPMEEVHHIIPVSRGGTSTEDNLMSLCRSCHNKKHVELGDR